MKTAKTAELWMIYIDAGFPESNWLSDLDNKWLLTCIKDVMQESELAGWKRCQKEMAEICEQKKSNIFGEADRGIELVKQTILSKRDARAK